MRELKTEGKAVGRKKIAGTESFPSQTSFDGVNEIKDLAAVTCFFNPAGYKTKLINYRRFREQFSKVGVQLFTVECAFRDKPFELTGERNLIQIRTDSIMWQKESLLNKAIAALPKKYTKVLWLDCDILFKNPGWAAESARLLDTYSIIQPFEIAVPLQENETEFLGLSEAAPSFASIFTKHPQNLLLGRFHRHGHTGYAWGARREVFHELGLYGAEIVGNADHLMAHAFCGDFDSPCVGRIVGENTPYRKHFQKWCGPVYRRIRSRLSYVPGVICHLWHGDRKDRHYDDFKFRKEFPRFKFDPSRDICLDKSGCLKWNSINDELHDWAENIFTLRKEDG
jgi:hypothetical protein